MNTTRKPIILKVSAVDGENNELKTTTNKMSPIQQANSTSHQLLKRRHFLQSCATGMGMMVLGSMSSKQNDIFVEHFKN